jgi:ubiquinone/menaquinone biosynthesis C-methylase UbiE
VSPNSTLAESHTSNADEHPATSRSLAVSIAEGYERWARTYDQIPNPLLAREQRYLLPLLTNLHKKRSLDLACGTGRWLEILMRHGVELGVGVDFSMAMLNMGSRKNCITGRLAQATCGNLPFPAAVFDLAICSFALGHLQELQSSVRELARVTRPHADVFVSDLHPEAYERGWRVGFRDGTLSLEIEMVPRTAEQIAQVFCSNGFESGVYVALSLGEPEKPIFDRSGKSHLFATACQLPAILFCHFKRASESSVRSSHL